MLTHLFCTVILYQQLFCINDRIWYLINSPEFQSVVLVLTASATLWKLSAKQSLSFNSTSRNFSYYWYVVCGGFLENSRHTNFFWKTPAKVWSNLKNSNLVKFGNDTNCQQIQVRIIYCVRKQDTWLCILKTI